MGRKKHSKESIIATLRNLAARLKNDTLSQRDVNSVLPVSSINYHFGSLRNAMKAAGLRCLSTSEHLTTVQQERYSNDDLFLSLLQLERQLGHQPKALEYTSQGNYSITPFRDRFGPWPEVIKHYKKWKQERHTTADSEAVSNPEQSPNIGRSVIHVNGHQSLPNYSDTNIQPTHFYGEPIDFRDLRHAPTNEQGVVYLFGMVSRELGFYIEAIQQGFSDCEGKYLHDGKKNLWAKARIEFEFRASSFKEHGHDPNGCDFVDMLD